MGTAIPKIDIRPCALCHTNETGFVCTGACNEQVEALAPSDPGEFWSFLRSVMAQGASIYLDYADGVHKGYEAYSARLDAAASERTDEWIAAHQAPPAAPLAPSDEQIMEATAHARRSYDLMTEPTAFITAVVRAAWRLAPPAVLVEPADPMYMPNEVLVKYAQDAAYAVGTSQGHSYTPKSAEAARDWRPHWWVCEAIQSAWLDGQSFAHGKKSLRMDRISWFAAAPSGVTKQPTPDRDPNCPVCGQHSFPLTPAALDVLAERQRQVLKEGWTPEHDDEHAVGDLERAAAVYALHHLGVPGSTRIEEFRQPLWPWDWDWLKPKNRRSNLVKSAALVLAAIEKGDREYARAVPTPDAYLKGSEG